MNCKGPSLRSITKQRLSFLNGRDLTGQLNIERNEDFKEGLDAKKVR
jgi:hypothetical protein